MLFKTNNYINKSVRTPFGVVKFNDGYADIMDKEVQDYMKTKGYKPVKKEEPEVEEPEVTYDLIDVEKMKSVIPKNWTLAKICEYADEVGITIPDDLEKKEDMRHYLEVQYQEIMK